MYHGSFQDIPTLDLTHAPSPCGFCPRLPHHYRSDAYRLINEVIPDIHCMRGGCLANALCSVSGGRQPCSRRLVALSLPAANVIHRPWGTNASGIWIVAEKCRTSIRCITTIASNARRISLPFRKYQASATSKILRPVLLCLGKARKSESCVSRRRLPPSALSLGPPQCKRNR